jgi:RHS repeat-associated protein
MDSLDVADDLDTDGICLDGQRLFEDPEGSRQYRAERETFSLIEQLPNGAFRVRTKTGETRYYGWENQARVTVPATLRQGESNHEEVAIWALDRVVDAWGNFYKVVYNNGNRQFAQDGLRVTSMHYTGHVTGGDPDNVDTNTFNTVTFQYCDGTPETCPRRPDVRWMRFLGARFPKNALLKSITTPRGVYSMTYQTDASGILPTELRKIDYCAAGTCLKALDFGWTPASYSWQSSSGYSLAATTPGATDLKGTALIDLDGDGRPEFALARDGSSSKVYETLVRKNTGHGWAIAPAAWTLPAFLSDANGTPTGARFADVDGDGRPDLIQDQADLQCTVSGCVVCKHQPSATDCPGAVHVSPAVWLNKITPDGGGWLLDRDFENVPGLGNLDFKGTFTPGLENQIYQYDTLADLNGDGRVDVVRLHRDGGSGLLIIPSLNTLEGWEQLPTISNTGMDTCVPGANRPHLQDLNRDGLSDLVLPRYFQFPDNHIEASECAIISRGVAADASGNLALSFTSMYTRNVNFAGSTEITETHQPAVGDLDGDGFYDLVSFFHVDGQDPTAYRAGIARGDGTGMGFDAGGTAGYLSMLGALSPKDVTGGEGIFVPEDYGYALVDVNADGLADLIRNHGNRQAGSQFPNQGGGQVLINTGTTWKDLNGIETWQIPAGPNHAPTTPDDVSVKDGSVFVDLDGDGVTDMLKVAGLASQAWVNTFEPPVITGFPNGLAKTTSVSYSVISTDEARSGDNPTYTDTGLLGFGYTFVMLPLRVVASVATDNGIGGTATTTYRYSDLRGSAFGYGPQGFRTVTVTEPSDPTRNLAGMITETTFAQFYPFTGLPRIVKRSTQDPTTKQSTGTVTSNETRYCDVIVADVPGAECPTVSPRLYPPRQTIFVNPVSITDITYARTGLGAEPNPPQLLTTVAAIRYDDKGNPIRTTTTTEGGWGETHTREVQNIYGASGSEERRLGKVTRTTVTSGSITHTTTLEYATFFGALALAKKKIEPGAPADKHVEQHTAYAYDSFGNVVTTTVCASDFEDCSPGAAGPLDLPFRTTTVSYDTSVLDVSVSYANGRFPTMTQNAAGHVEFTAYDPLLGTVVEKKGPNGIRTCYEFDVFGQPLSATERCRAAELTTSTRRYLPKNPPPPGPCHQDVCVASQSLTKLIVVTSPPAASPTWTFADALGRTIGTESFGFGGELVQTLTEYDPLGRVSRASKPFLSSQVPSWTATSYDPLGRPRTITQDLGTLGDPSTGTGIGTAATTMSYAVTNPDPAAPQGSTILTARTVNGVLRQIYETKNALGKIAAVTDATDAEGRTISYVYDADGNLTDTFDPDGNSIHVQYEFGRKISTDDPDLGHWLYGYNGFGELASQTDAKGQTTSMTYDVLGRMTSRTNTQGTAEWVYDVSPGAGVGKLAFTVSAPDDRLQSTCSHPITAENLGKRAVRAFTYTAFGDVAETDECNDGDVFQTNYDYDAFGRQQFVTYPVAAGARFAVQYHYSASGHLHYVSEVSTGAVYWAATAVNAAGQVTAEYTRNGVDTISKFSSATGWLLSRSSLANADGGTLIQSWAYRFDEAGNLRRRLRLDRVAGDNSDEVFAYDNRDRLIGAQAVAPSSYAEAYEYDGIGNIKKKGGKDYTYGGCSAGTRPAGPHAVCTVQGLSPFAYDDNGNMISGADRTIDYDNANKVTHILSEPLGGGSATADFIYGADGNRIVQATAAGGSTARTVYVGLGATGKSIYERTKKGATTLEHTHFIYAGVAHGANAFAVRTITEDTGTLATTTATRYYHFDHLGSVTAVSDEQGHVIDPESGGRSPGVLSYDAWGARRPSEHVAANPALFDPPAGHREFTGHETIPGVGLINMNGRVYDPVVGRFLSPDPNIQFIAELQSYNRYSYALNNPLRYTDPTGFFVNKWFDIAVDVGIVAAAVIVCAGSEGAGCGFAFVILATVYTSASAINSGAPFNQVVLVAGVNLIGGCLGGAIGGGVVSGFGGGAAATIAGGAIGGAATSLFTTTFLAKATGQQLSWEQLGVNVLIGAASGALTAAATFAIRNNAVVSQASAAAPAAGGEEAGAQRAERAEVADAQDADAAPPARRHRAAQVMTREQAAARYGAIEGDRWPGRRQWVVHYDVPEDVLSDPSYRLVDPRGQQVRGFWVNRDLVGMLDDAFHNLQQAGVLGELDTYNGSFNIRAVRGRDLVSAHSWGIAIDFNAAANPLGAQPAMSPAVVQAFTDAGFTWGGNFGRPDGMHFSLGF